MQLTEDGRVFHTRARDLLDDVDDLHSMFASDQVALCGRLRVDLPSELARTTASIRNSTATRGFSCQVRANSVQTYEAAGVAGLGLIQAPPLAIGRYLQSGALIELLPDCQHKPLDVSLVIAHRRNLSRRVRAFMKWIENVLAPYLE